MYIFKTPPEIERTFYFRRCFLCLTYIPHRHPSRAIRFDGQQLIFLENTLSAAEQWQTFGHILMHVGNQQSMDSNFIAYQEWQADLFALHFCVCPPSYYIPNDCRHATELVADTFHVTLPFAYERLQMYKQKLNDQQFHMYLWNNLIHLSRVMI